VTLTRLISHVRTLELATALGDLCPAQQQRTAVRRDPVFGRQGYSVGSGDLHDAAEPHDEVEAELVFQKLVKSLVAEASVGEHRHLHALGEDLAKALEQPILVLIPPALQLGLHHGLPEERRGPTMARDHRQHDGGLVVLVEIGPVERSRDLEPVADDERDPAREQVPGGNAVVAEQPVDLLHRVLGPETLRHRERLADGVDPEGGTLQHPHGGSGERGHALRVEVVCEDGGDELGDPVAVERLVAHGAAA
jgi:hypothetical protein